MPLPPPDPQRIERTLDRLRAMVLALSVGWLLVVAHQFTPRPRLDAERFVLRDSARVFRGALEMREDGAAVVRLNAADTKPRFYAMVMPDGRPRLRLTDAAGVHRLQAELAPDERVHLLLTDDQGRSRLHLWVDRSGEPSISWRDTAGVHQIPLEAPAALDAKRPARR